MEIENLTENLKLTKVELNQKNLDDVIAEVLETKRISGYMLQKRLGYNTRKSAQIISSMLEKKIIEKQGRELVVINEKEFKKFAEEVLNKNHYLNGYALNVCINQIVCDYLLYEDEFIEELNIAIKPPVNVFSGLEKRKNHIIKCINDPQKHYIFKIVALNYISRKYEKNAKIYLDDYNFSNFNEYLRNKNNS